MVMPTPPPAEDGRQPRRVVPRIQTSVGALLHDTRDRLLLLKPTYKSGWTLPGGEMEESGETPWEACQREVFEECGLTVGSARLACVDFRRPKPGRLAGLRLLFDCGAIDDAALDRITLQAEEIADHRLAPLDEAMTLLRKAIRDRVAATVAADGFVYLEQGRPVAAVSSAATPRSGSPSHGDRNRLTQTT